MTPLSDARDHTPLVGHWIRVYNIEISEIQLVTSNARVCIIYMLQSNVIPLACTESQGIIAIFPSDIHVQLKHSETT